MTRMEKYKSLRDSIRKLNLPKADRELMEYDFKLADADVLKQLSRKAERICSIDIKKQ